MNKERKMMFVGRIFKWKRSKVLFEGNFAKKWINFKVKSLMNFKVEISVFKKKLLHQ
jgi:hypothetical protein